jgi:hypothetical protein
VVDRVWRALLDLSPARSQEPARPQEPDR